MSIMSEINEAVRAGKGMQKHAIQMYGGMNLVQNEDGMPVPYTDNTLLPSGGNGGTPVTVGGAKKEKTWSENREIATNVLGFDPINRNRARGALFGAAALPIAASPGTLLGLALKSPVATGGAVGTFTGLDEGMRTNDPVKGVGTGLENAALTTTLLGGNLVAAGLEGSGAAAANRIADGGSVADAATDAAITGATYAAAGGLGKVIRAGGSKVAPAARKAIGAVAPQVPKQVSGVMANTAKKIPGATNAVRSAAGATMKAIKSIPVPNAAAYAANTIAPALIDVKDAVKESIADKQRKFEDLKKMMRYGGTALGGLMALMLAKGLIGGNGGGSSGSGEEKRKKSAWEQMLDSVLMAGAVGAGAYGGYKLSDPAFNYLYDKVRWDAMGKGIKSVWNDVKAKFS